MGLYPHFNFTRPTLFSDAVLVWLMNEEQPPVWDQVNSWIEQHGSIANRELRTIANVDTLKASKMLKQWVEHGLLIADGSKGKRGRVYRLPGDQEKAQSLLSGTGDNKSSDG
jgi:ATP-dependent DNA helicase RecG